MKKIYEETIFEIIYFPYSDVLTVSEVKGEEDEWNLPNN